VLGTEGQGQRQQRFGVVLESILLAVQRNAARAQVISPVPRPCRAALGPITALFVPGSGDLLVTAEKAGRLGRATAHRASSQQIRVVRTGLPEDIHHPSGCRIHPGAQGVAGGHCDPASAHAARDRGSAAAHGADHGRPAHYPWWIHVGRVNPGRAWRGPFPRSIRPAITPAVQCPGPEGWPRIGRDRAPGHIQPVDALGPGEPVPPDDPSNVELFVSDGRQIREIVVFFRNRRGTVGDNV
jgi:hypothetical protein